MSHSAQDLAGRRENAPHTSMFVRMLVRAAILRRGRAASALFAMVVAAAVATAMLNLYVDVQAKLRREHHPAREEQHFPSRGYAGAGGFDFAGTRRGRALWDDCGADCRWPADRGCRDRVLAGEDAG